MKKTILLASLASLLCFTVNPVLADQSQMEWDEWKVMGDGYFARRQVPSRFSEEVSQRQSADVVDRDSGVRSIALGAVAESNLATQSDSVLIQNITQGSRSILSQSLTNSVDHLLLKTEGEGIFSVSISELAAISNNTEEDLIENILQQRLTITNDNETVRWLYYPDTSSIIFFGEENKTFFTNQNAFQITLLATNQSDIIGVTDSGDVPSQGVANSFPESIKFEEEPSVTFSLAIVADERDADYWFWDFLFSNGQNAFTVPIELPNPVASGSAEIRIVFRGATDINANGNDHEVAIELNGTSIGQNIVWDAFDEVEFVATFDQSLLNPEGNNEVTVSNVSAAGAPANVQWLDQIEVDYERQAVAKNGTLLLSELPIGANQLVTGFDSDQILVLQDPNGVSTLRQDANVIAEADGSFSVVFDTQSTTEYLVTEVDSILSGEMLIEDRPSDLASSSNLADYLIIAPRVFSGTAEELKSFRQSDFANIKIAWLDDIYDEFSAGNVDPFAITRFLEVVQSDWNQTPAHVVILGKGSLDHRDRLGFGDSFVPTLMTNTPFALAASDNRLLAGNDTIADFSIGRIPITNDDQGIQYVAKLRDNTQPTNFGSVLVADNVDEGDKFAGDFIQNSEDLAGRLVDEFGFEDLLIQREYHPNTPSVRSQMLLSSTWETGLVNYDGHGSATQIGDVGENFLNASDVADLSNQSHPIFSALTCSAGDFSFPGLSSLAGALVLNPTGGAAAAFAPTGLSLDADAQIMGNAFYDSLYTGGNTIGISLAEAKSLTQFSVLPFMYRVYSVIGDPAVNAR